MSHSDVCFDEPTFVILTIQGNYLSPRENSLWLLFYLPTRNQTEQLSPRNNNKIFRRLILIRSADTLCRGGTKIIFRFYRRFFRDNCAVS